ncbi:uncharacterized protein L3040_004712 [Drepanopeziza brunnea f. sp. 'multigermtubi']|uniref:uncharacterized protein n=1 Tax=Drepanopeziza brunnea f. sp. 'multigermtubi' TaxID=698441 RepID=UPI002394A4A6|nr:hypothetical protein L3040_004712 [Drepanopeziza brunnea f. sp. 'multigermtubi']
MPPSTARRDTSHKSLGQRRDKSDLARCSVDLSWTRAASDSARSRAYPSPPMSGSPPLPPRRNLESSDRGHGSYGSGGQDVYRGLQTPQMDHMESRGSPLRGYMPEQPPSMLYPVHYRPEQMGPTQAQYQQALPQVPPQPQPHHGYAPHPQALQQFPAPDRQPVMEAPGFESPKQQRKTKGHVASACVPCKRAHLRCDAQRPCSRCLSNGKEETCIDVQHKKRGRPRLRDEREPRYEAVGAGYPPPVDHSMRRPLSMYPSTDPASFTDTLQRPGSYRVLKSHGGLMGGGSMGPRYTDHASSADANMYGAPVPPRMTSSFEPPCAYLTMEMQFVKTTQSFGETIGVQSIQSRRLQDLVSANDRNKVACLQKDLEEERRGREPNYLPPIYLTKFEEDHVIQTIGFGPEDIGSLRIDRQEMFTFQAPDGQQRTFQATNQLLGRRLLYQQLPASAATLAMRCLFIGRTVLWDRGPPLRSLLIPKAPLPTRRHGLSHGFQLPPIRDQRGELLSCPTRRRDDRSGRVDIGGLLEQPGSDRRGA